VQGVLYSGTSSSSIITDIPTTLPSSTVYYAPLPYRYSNLIVPVTFLVTDEGTEDSFLFAAVDGNHLASPPAPAIIVSLRMHTAHSELFNKRA